ncbi:hypothetical protein AOQ84DRAFT_405106, partial [Glonium stellatum]
NAVIHDAYYWGRVGFRAAWISVTQVSLVVLLAGKINIIGILIGSSHERLNWLHRWVARTLFICVTIHGAFFLADWVRADFVTLELEMMPMVKYGLGSWGILCWTNITGLAPFRRMAYEIFVIQHLACAAILLWLLHQHVPIYAMHNIWIAIGFVTFDKVAYYLYFAYRNFSRRRPPSELPNDKASLPNKISKPRALAWRAGYRAEIGAMDSEVTIITIKDITFSWRPGQHLYIRIPMLGVIESHPFTISNASRLCNEPIPSDVKLVIRVHSGFSRRLHNKALAARPGVPVVMKAFIAGPFGNPPAWNTFETVLLISASTGASFTVPILESILMYPGCVSQLRFLLLIQQWCHCDAYLKTLEALASQVENFRGISIRIEIAVSKEFPGDPKDAEILECSTAPAALGNNGKTDSPARGNMVRFSFGRASLSEFILEPIEKAFGETMVAVCGGKPLTSDVRNIIAKISDDRAVHKGTGAQDICLFIEEFAF